MIICNITEEGRFGGPARRIIQVANALKLLGVDTHVVYPNLNSEMFTNFIAHTGITATSLNLTRLTKEKKILAIYIIRFPVEIIFLYFFFRKNKFDLIHVNGSYQFKSAIAGKLAGIPVVWHMNDMKMARIVKIIACCLAEIIASAFIVTGMGAYNYYIRGTILEKIPYCSIQVPVDTKKFDPENTKPHKIFCKIKGVKIVTTVSSITPTKGIEYLIEIASKLLSCNDNIYFYVAGAVVKSHIMYYKKLKEILRSFGIAEENFVFTGMIEEISSFLQGADIYVYTSLSESGPAAVWEAMSMGKPVVSTNVGSVNEYIEDGVSGFIAPVKDINRLTEKVQMLIDNPSLRQDMGSRARITAQKQLDVTIAAQKHADFYQKIITLTKNSHVQ